MAKDELLFLDMKMSWFLEGDVQFGVFRKKGQQLNYTGMGSANKPGNICAIPSGVFNILAKLTFTKTFLHSEGVDKIYPDHVDALREAGLATPNLPKMGE